MADKAVIDEIVEKIASLSAMDLADLSKAIQDKFGVQPMAAVAAASPAIAGGAGNAAAVEEKTAFDVILNAAGDKKIQVIKVVRELTSLGLKEAKELVDNAPSAVKEGIPEEEAKAAMEKLQEVGAQVELK